MSILLSRPRRPHVLPLALGLLALLCALTLPAHATNFVVTSTADTDGTSCGATCTLRQAINAANNAAGDDSITFDATAFAAPRKSIDVPSGNLPAITTNLTIVAPAAGVEIKTSAGQSAGLVSVNGGTVELDDLPSPVITRRSSIPAALSRCGAALRDRSRVL